jgi:Family of unknown function (DUF7033)
MANSFAVSEVTRVEAPLDRPGIEYAWRELARRAGLTLDCRSESGLKALGVLLHYGQPSEVRHAAPALVVRPCSPGQWRSLLLTPAGKLETTSLQSALPPGVSLPFQDPLPVLFRADGGTEDGCFARREGDIVVFDCDVIAAALFLLSRWEEMVNPVRDEHGRMPFSESVAHKQGFLERPLVDEYALILREWLKVLLPGWLPEHPSFSVKLTHDVDAIRRFGRLGGGVRTLAGDLFKHRNLRSAAKTSEDILAQLFVPERGRAHRGIVRLAEISKRHGMRSAFYFMSASPAGYDQGYDPGSRIVRRCIDRLRRDGFEIGIHPSYRTSNDPGLLACEKSRFDAVLGNSRYGGRQHYLRFQVPETWRYLEEVGLSYDSTLTYAGHEGFRCGTSHPFRPFDLHARRELALWEVPPVVMDGTLKRYRSLTPGEAEQQIQRLANRCASVGGCFTLLWHNTSLEEDWSEWGLMYERVVQSLSLMRPCELSLPSPLTDGGGLQ